MSKPNFFGVGPRIARILLPWLAITILLSLFFPGIFSFPNIMKPYLLAAGITWLIPGLVLYVISGKMMTKAVREGYLVTRGPYRFCRNPLYAMVILFIIPGVALMMNSWLILSTTVAGYLAFKSCIGGEYREMVASFGDAYREYSRKTPEFFPWWPKP